MPSSACSSDLKTASKTYTATYQKGKTYSVTSPVIDGYTASEKTVKGTIRHTR